MENALQILEEHGFTVTPKSSGHAWGRVDCPTGECKASPVSSTPKNADNLAKQLRRFMQRCPHRDQ